MRVLQIGSDRSKRGILVPGTHAYMRQTAYAGALGALDIIGYSLRSDGFKESEDGPLRVYPTNAPLKLLYGTYALLIARKLSRPDIVSTQDPHDSGLLGLCIARMRGVSFHVQVHSDVFDPEYVFFSPVNFVRSHIARFVLKRADNIRVVSHRIKESVEKVLLPKRPISVLPIYIDANRLRKSEPEVGERFAAFKTKLLFVGRLEPEKHPCLALESFAAADLKDTCLIVVGDGSERDHVRLLATDLGVADRVFFENERDAAPYYRVADLVLCTSRYEGYGLAIAEALFCGKPVLSTDVGAAREMGALIAEEDHYAEALSAWMESGPRSAELQLQAYTDIESYAKALRDDIARTIQP